MAASAKKPYQVAVLIYNGADILDFAGPVEMLTHIYNDPDPFTASQPTFHLTTIAEARTVSVGHRALTITADSTIHEAHKRLGDFDILVVPGGAPDRLMELVEKDGPEMQFTRDFATQKPEGNAKEGKVILSVCTGALLVGATGTMGGLEMTTHHMAYDLLRQVCAKFGPSDGAKTKVVEATKTRRYVDSGVNGSGVRVITAGGVTCGLDASLYLAAMKVGEENAQWAADLTEHEWKKASV
ncbi:MAG: hypothetical protein Q9218_005714 [Villophora microphyllina]